MERVDGNSLPVVDAQSPPPLCPFDTESKSLSVSSKTPSVKDGTPRRSLNLEDYKKRRGLIWRVPQCCCRSLHVFHSQWTSAASGHLKDWVWPAVSVQAGWLLYKKNNAWWFFFFSFSKNNLSAAFCHSLVLGCKVIPLTKPTVFLKNLNWRLRQFHLSGQFDLCIQWAYFDALSWDLEYRKHFFSTAVFCTCTL